MFYFTGNETASATPVFGPVEAPTETMTVDIQEVCAFFEVENMDQSVPLLCVRTSLDCKLTNWTKHVSTNSFCNMNLSRKFSI